MRIVELQTRPLTEAAPTPNTIGKEKDTIIAQQVSATEVELYVTDDRGKVLKARTGSTSGGGGSTPPIKDVLTAGNALDGKHFEGVLKSIDSDVPNNVSSTFNSDKDSVSYSRTTNDENTSFDVSSRGVSFNSNNSSTNENTSFEATQSLRYSKNNFNSDVKLEASDFSLKYGISDRSMPGNDMEFIVEKERVTYSIPYRDPLNPMAPATPLRYEVGAEGIKANKYLKPSQDEQFVQKKYVDGLLGGKPEVTIDNMYLTYGGKLALHVTIENMDSTTINSPEPHKYSVLHMFTTSPGSGNMAELFNLNGSDSRVSNIQQVYKDVDSGTYKFRFEINPSPLVSWFAATKNENLFTTKGQFDYINDNLGTIRVKSRPTYYGELYKKDQAGVVSFVPKVGSSVKGEIIPTSSEIDYFRTNQNVFETESVFRIAGNNYNLEVAGGGAPLGSLDMSASIEPFTTDGKIMSNPTPGQVTDWELTIGLSGGNIDAIDTQNYAAVICDADDNVLDSKPIFPFTKGFVPAHPHDIKVTLRTINTFKNIIGNGKGFKLGIRTAAASSGLDVKFELKSFKRISHSLA